MINPDRLPRNWRKPSQDASGDDIQNESELHTNAASCPVQHDSQSTDAEKSDAGSNEPCKILKESTSDINNAAAVPEDASRQDFEAISDIPSIPKMDNIDIPSETPLTGDSGADAESLTEANQLSEECQKIIEETLPPAAEPESELDALDKESSSDTQTDTGSEKKAVSEVFGEPDTAQDRTFTEEMNTLDETPPAYTEADAGDAGVSELGLRQESSKSAILEGPRDSDFVTRDAYVAEKENMSENSLSEYAFPFSEDSEEQLFPDLGVERGFSCEKKNSGSILRRGYPSTKIMIFPAPVSA